MNKVSARKLTARGDSAVDLQDPPVAQVAETPESSPMEIAPDSPDRFINRELSWLDFNHRVWRRRRTRAIRCWSACASSRSAPPTWTSSIRCASPA